jgi:hypothetical protein
MTNERCRSLWQARTAEYEASGLSVREWCEKTGFTVHQLRYWLRKLRNTADSQASLDAGSGWACVELVEDGVADQAIQPNASGKCTEMAMGDGGVCLRVGVATIEVRRGFDAVLLSKVLRVVVATC